MASKNRRWLSIVVATVLVVALLPIPAGMAGATVTKAHVAPKPVKTPVVVAKATIRGIRLRVKNHREDVSAIDVFRSTAAGDMGTQLNASPIPGTNYLDETAKTGVQYYYTVRVAGRSKDTHPAGYQPRYQDMSIFPQAKATKMKAMRTHALPVAPKPLKLTHIVRAPATKSHIRRGTPVSKVKGIRTTITGPTTITVNTVWTTAMSPIYIMGGDIVVASGKTLTINPGVKVYFDTFDTLGSEPTTIGAEGVTWETNDNPTTKCDMIVHGKLTANGTAAKPILFSSVQASLNNTQTDPPPQAGYWGSIFFDSLSASQMMNTKVEFGEGVWARGTTRPYLVNNWLSNNNTANFMPYGQIFFENPVGNAASPRPRIIGNHIMGGLRNGIAVFALDMGTATLDPLIQGNVVKTQNPLMMAAFNESDTTPAGDYMLKGTMTGNTFISPNGEVSVYLYVETTGTGTGRIYPTLTNNAIRNNIGYGFFSVAEADDTGNSYNKPVITGGTIYSGHQALRVAAFSDDSTITNLGKAQASPKVTGTKIASQGDDAIYLYADANGAGAAQADSSFTNVRFETSQGDDTGSFDSAVSHWGPASASPTFLNCTGLGHNQNDPLLQCVALCEVGSGLAKANPSWTGGRIHNTSGEGIANYSQSTSGTAQSMAKVINVPEVFATNSLVFSEAYGDNSDTNTAGGANASTTWTNSKGWGLEDNDPAIVNVAGSGGKGAATASPKITKSTIRGAYQGGPVYTLALSLKGPATASPVITDSSLVSPAVSNGGGDGVACYAFISDALGVGNATCNPKFTNSTVRTSYDGVVLCEAVNNGTGNAVANPTATKSRFLQTAGDGGFTLLAGQNGTGTAEASPVITDSTIDVSDDACVYVEVHGPGLVNGGLGTSFARANGTFTNCLMRSDWEDGYEGYASNNGGGAESKPRFNSCTFETPDDGYAVYDNVSGWGPAGTSLFSAPYITGGSASKTGDGIYSTAQGNNSDSTETVMNQTRVAKIPIYSAFDYGVYTQASTNGHGDVTNDTLVNMAPISSYDGVDTYASTSGDGDTLNTSRVLGDPKKRSRVESFDDYGVDHYTYSQLGNATDKTKTQNLAISSNNSGVSAYTSTDGGATMTATSMPFIKNNVIDDKWVLDEDGINVQAYSDGHAVLSPKILNNTVKNPVDNGIEMYIAGSVTNTGTPLVEFNNISMAGDNGIQYGVLFMGPELGTDSVADIDFNTISKARANGIALFDIPYAEIEQNKIIWCGAGGGVAVTSGRKVRPTDEVLPVAGIAWFGPKAAGEEMSEIEGNFIKDNRIGIALEGNQGFPIITANAFADGTFEAGNRPWNIWTNASQANTVPAPGGLAPGNWWGYTASSDISRTIAEVATDGAVNYATQRNRYAPKLLSISAVKSAGKIFFTLVFDEPMDPLTHKLAFGPGPHYNAFPVNGKWQESDDYHTWKGSRTAAGVPSNVWMWFSRAKARYGAAMKSTDKKFKL